MQSALRSGSFALLALACACSGSLPRPPYVAQPSSALFVVPVSPPPPRVEQVPDSPAHGAVWLDGEWVYRRGRWAWLLGRWVTPPPGAFFSPWAVVRAPDGTVYYAPGQWLDKDGNAVHPPAPIAIASASAGPVVDSEGVIQLTGRTVKPGAATSPSAEAEKADEEGLPESHGAQDEHDVRE